MVSFKLNVLARLEIGRLMQVTREDYIKHCEADWDGYTMDVFQITNGIFDDYIIEDCYQNWKRDVESDLREDLKNKRVSDW